VVSTTLIHPAALRGSFPQPDDLFVDESVTQEFQTGPYRLASCSLCWGNLGLVLWAEAYPGTPAWRAAICAAVATWLTEHLLRLLARASEETAAEAIPARLAEQHAATETRRRHLAARRHETVSSG